MNIPLPPPRLMEITAVEFDRVSPSFPFHRHGHRTRNLAYSGGNGVCMHATSAAAPRSAVPSFTRFSIRDNPIFALIASLRQAFERFSNTLSNSIFKQTPYLSGKRDVRCTSSWSLFVVVEIGFQWRICAQPFTIDSDKRRCVGIFSSRLAVPQTSPRSSSRKVLSHLADRSQTV